MTTREDLLYAICCDPFDTAGRLMFADWCEENGEVERAEFVRVQCELDGWELMDIHPLNGVAGLRRREQELIYLRGLTLAGDPAYRLLSQDPTAWHESFRRGFVEVVHCTLEEWIGTECPACHGRGGNEEYNLDDPLNHFMHGSQWYDCSECHGTGRIGGHGVAIVASQPILEVKIKYQGKSPILPTQLRETTIVHLASPNLSVPECRSRALIDHARKQAGLPELDWTNRTIKEAVCV